MVCVTSGSVLLQSSQPNSLCSLIEPSILPGVCMTCSACFRFTCISSPASDRLYTDWTGEVRVSEHLEETVKYFYVALSLISQNGENFVLKIQQPAGLVKIFDPSTLEAKEVDL